jgi:hypothetical protein
MITSEYPHSTAVDPPTARILRGSSRKVQKVRCDMLYHVDQIARDDSSLSINHYFLARPFASRSNLSSVPSLHTRERSLHSFIRLSEIAHDIRSSGLTPQRDLLSLFHYFLLHVAVSSPSPSTARHFELRHFGRRGFRSRG